MTAATVHHPCRRWVAGKPGSVGGRRYLLPGGNRTVAQGEYLGCDQQRGEYTAATARWRSSKPSSGRQKAKNAQVHVHADSNCRETDDRQYKVKDTDLTKLFVQLTMRCLILVRYFFHVPRERIPGGARMVNEALDRQDAPGLGI